MNDSIPSNGRRLVALGLLALLLLGVVGSGIVLYRSQHLTDSPYSLQNSGAPIVSDADRQQAVAVAEQFALRVDSVNTGDLKGYINSVSQLLTTKFKAKFLADASKVGSPSGTPTGSSTATPGEQATGKVYSSGVSAIDSDSATVIVAHDQKFLVNGRSVAQGFRWVITLRKVNGTWLVDSSTDIDGNG